MSEEKPPLEQPLLSKPRTPRWLLPIALESGPIVEPDIIVAIGLLWALGLVIALATLPWGLILSIVVSFLVALCLGCMCLLIEREGLVKLARPANVLSLFGVGLGISVFSLVGDCIVGSLNSPAVSWFVACTEKSGIGFGITALLISFTVGITLVGLLRLAIRQARNHWF